MLDFLKNLFSREGNAEWVLIGKTEAYPVSREKLVDGTQLTDALLQGSTTYIFASADNTRTKTITVPGLEQDAIPSILEWVDRYGNKRIEMDGRVYQVVRVFAEEDEKLPVRQEQTP